MRIIFSLSFFLALGIYFTNCGSSSSSSNFTLKGGGADGASVIALPATNASELKIKVYKFCASTNGDCSNPTCFSVSSPDFVDFLDAPTLAQGALPVASYKCVIIEMSDNIKFVPTASEGPCTQGTTYTIDVCRADNNSTSVLADGTTVTCTGTDDGTTQVLGDDRVALYVTTISTADEDADAAFTPPASGATSTPNGVNLASELVVTASTTGTFHVNADGKVNAEGQPRCGMAPPVFSFD